MPDSDMRVCSIDNEPLVFTMEFAGAEYVCVPCGNTEGVFGRRATATPERVRRHGELIEQYERDRAQRKGREYKPSPRVGDPGVETPTCKTCGAQPEPGTVLDSGKPFVWFSRSRDGVTEYACSRDCIPEREAVLPW